MKDVNTEVVRLVVHLTTPTGETVLLSPISFIAGEISSAGVVFDLNSPALPILIKAVKQKCHFISWESDIRWLDWQSCEVHVYGQRKEE